MKQQNPAKTGARQIHLDFHNAGCLEGIGEAFCKDRFVETLRSARVDSVNLFAKCHHSWSYYPTRVGRMHPQLGFDLLGSQIEACHEAGILAPVYYTVGWSAGDAEAHPEWCCRDRDGAILTNGEPPNDPRPDGPMPAFHWKFLCVNTGYHEHIMQQVEELCGSYPIDGLWFDIYQVHRLCYCESCLAGMKEEGIDPGAKPAVEAFNARNIKRHCGALRELIARHHPAASVFFNGTTAAESGANFRHRMFEHNTVQDLEDLPTVWGGYDKLPLQSKYFLKAGWPVTAMSGKFHTAWGEFGGFKHPDALWYEAASMIAWGARCNFGDQLHPCGAMDAATYRNIGKAYAYVAELEACGIGGLPVSRVGLWRCFDARHDEGLSRMLLEGHVDFDIANLSSDLSHYDVIIVPGRSCLSESDAKRLMSFSKQGGKLVVMGKGALDRNERHLLLDIGATYLGEGRYDCDYLLVGDRLVSGLPETPFLNHASTIRVSALPDTERLAAIREPFFSRTQENYTSHQNTPYRLQDAPHPGITRNGNVYFIAPALDALYRDHGARVHRDLFLNVLDLAGYRPMVATELPSAARISLLHQPQHERYVVHFLYAPPMKRGDCEVIEDMPPLFNVPLRVDLPVELTKASLYPGGESLPLEMENNALRLTIPRFRCHCAVVLDYSR
jgi:hypothetical protein